MSHQKISLLLSLENSVGIQFSEFLKDHKNLDCFIFIEQMLCLSSAYQEMWCIITSIFYVLNHLRWKYRLFCDLLHNCKLFCNLILFFLPMLIKIKKSVIGQSWMSCKIIFLRKLLLGMNVTWKFKQKIPIRSIRVKNNKCIT